VTIRWDTNATTRPALKVAMEGLGHTNITWDHAGFGNYYRGTCEHGCTGVLIDGVHSYGTGLDTCQGAK
jgi:hypothetical protein